MYAVLWGGGMPPWTDPLKSGYATIQLFQAIAFLFTICPRCVTSHTLAVAHVIFYIRMIMYLLIEEDEHLNYQYTIISAARVMISVCHGNLILTVPLNLLFAGLSSNAGQDAGLDMLWVEVFVTGAVFVTTYLTVESNNAQLHAMLEAKIRGTLKKQSTAS